jgi:hypothetical protein
MDAENGAKTFAGKEEMARTILVVEDSTCV